MRYETPRTIGLLHPKRKHRKVQASERKVLLEQETAEISLGEQICHFFLATFQCVLMQVSVRLHECRHVSILTLRLMVVRSEKSRRKVVRKIREVCWVVCPEEQEMEDPTDSILQNFPRALTPRKRKGPLRGVIQKCEGSLAQSVCSQI